MLTVEVVLEAVPIKVLPRATWEGVLELEDALLKYDIKYLDKLLCMTDQKPVPFY